jgi:histidinol-phosphatase (PHP family)
MDYQDADKKWLEGMFERYSHELCELAEWGDFHALAHADYPVRYFKINNLGIDVRKYYDLYIKVFEIIIRRGIALEINTSGLRKEHFGETMPSFDLLKIYKETGGELLTIGSDAHSTEQMEQGAESFRYVCENLLEIGFKYTSIIKNKKLEQIKIEL